MDDIVLKFFRCSEYRTHSNNTYKWLSVPFQIPLLRAAEHRIYNHCSCDKVIWIFQLVAVVLKSWGSVHARYLHNIHSWLWVLIWITIIAVTFDTRLEDCIVQVIFKFYLYFHCSEDSFVDQNSLSILNNLERHSGNKSYNHKSQMNKKYFHQEYFKTKLATLQKLKEQLWLKLIQLQLLYVV